MSSEGNGPVDGFVVFGCGMLVFHERTLLGSNHGTERDTSFFESDENVHLLRASSEGHHLPLFSENP